jgi:hypothetical protein
MSPRPMPTRKGIGSCKGRQIRPDFRQAMSRLSASYAGFALEERALRSGVKEIVGGERQGEALG